MTTNLTWYDVLGVPHDASAEEIKAAWRHATDRFEPGSGSGQFRMFNEAADVLLDPERRQDYDAELGAGDPRPGAVAAGGTVTGPGTSRTPAASVPPPVPAPVEEPAPRGRTRATRRPRTRGPASRASRVVAAVLAVLAVVAVGLAVHLALDVRHDNAVADARDAAPGAAERAAKAVLSYDYRELPTDRQRASAYLTDSFKKKYLANFALLEKQKDGSPGAAVQTKTVVTASVLGSGVVDAEDGRARVLVFVNQVSQKPGAQPQIFQNRVAMDMRQQGNRWLVDDLKSY